MKKGIDNRLIVSYSLPLKEYILDDFISDIPLDVCGDLLDVCGDLLLLVFQI